MDIDSSPLGLLELQLFQSTRSRLLHPEPLWPLSSSSADPGLFIPQDNGVRGRGSVSRDYLQSERGYLSRSGRQPRATAPGGAEYNNNLCGFMRPYLFNAGLRLRFSNRARLQRFLLGTGMPICRDPFPRESSGTHSNTR